MVEWGELQSHLGWRGANPPAQLEERHQTFPPARLIARPKGAISQPHAQIGYPHLQDGHDLIFGVIQFPHRACTGAQVFLLSQDLPEDTTGPFTESELSFTSHAGGFEQDMPMMDLPLHLQALGFHDKQAWLVLRVAGLQGSDLG